MLIYYCRSRSFCQFHAILNPLTHILLPRLVKWITFSFFRHGTLEATIWNIATGHAHKSIMERPIFKHCSNNLQKRSDENSFISGQKYLLSWQAEGGKIVSSRDIETAITPNDSSTSIAEIDSSDPVYEAPKKLVYLGRAYKDDHLMNELHHRLSSAFNQAFPTEQLQFLC